MYPYNRQTSTKLIEYLTLQEKDVISNKYKWVMDFRKGFNLGMNRLIITLSIFIMGDYIAQDWHSVIDKSKYNKDVKRIMNHFKIQYSFSIERLLRTERPWFCRFNYDYKAYGVEVYGEYAYYFAIINILGVALSLGLDDYFVKCAAESHSANKITLYTNCTE